MSGQVLAAAHSAPAPIADAWGPDANACASAIYRLWPQATRHQALYVAHAENGTGDPHRVSPQNWNGTFDRGCFQVNDIHRGSRGYPSDVYDADQNVAYALALWHVRGWGAWSSICGGNRPRVFSCSPPKP